MKLTLLTLFPELIAQLRSYGIIGRAIRNGSIDLSIVQIRDYTASKHGKVDDAPYGGGAGMIMGCQPIADAIDAAAAPASHVVYLSPQGAVLTQEKARELSEKEDLVLLCGHYEGIDERLLHTHIDEEISIGDYILTGGELPAMVLVDVMARFLEDTVGSRENVESDSLSDGLLKHPQYTRPQNWRGLQVPEILLSGDHKRIDAYRQEESLRVTRAKRPDLYEAYQKKSDEENNRG